MDATINDQPVRLVLDTGAEDIVLFRPSAKRLKLKATSPSADFRPAPGQAAGGKSEECLISIGTAKWRREVAVVDLPKDMQARIDFDGVVGWYVVRKNILQIQGNDRRFVDLAELPNDIGQWTRYDLLKDATVLVFRSPAGDGANVGITIDTGDEGGVRLSAEHWRKWRRDNADRAGTIEEVWNPAAGNLARELCWADRLMLGSLSVADVPVTESPVVGLGPLKDCQASLGLFALTRLDVIVDWPKGSLYVRPVDHPRWIYPHNRIGAAFLPGGSKGSDLVAHVADRSPAYQAGIRKGDVLLKIDELDVTKWQTDPTVLPLNPFWFRPAGTKLRLVLKRDGKPFEVAVELKEILIQRAKQQGSSRPTASSSHADK